ncbi:hypothetical protein NDA18_003740 [Ustilago nuda]|nr:hypothetical protein NDA18_003740 [Ustilago nuda]
MLALKSQLISATLVLAFCAETLHAAHGGGSTYLCPPHSKILPHNTDYRKRCEGEPGTDGADPRWPCFTFWSGSLDNVLADTSATGKASQDFFLMKNGYKYDFTTADPTKDFNLNWLEENVQMGFSNFDHEKGCFKITLKHTSDDISRIWVSAQNSKDRDLDTWKRGETSTTLCTKWVHIHIKNDGKDF